MSNRPAMRQRTELRYRRDEWELLVSLPGRVVVAATAAHPDRAAHTVGEGLAGLEAIAAGRASASRLVRDVVTAIYSRSEDDAPVASGLPRQAAGVGDVLDGCRAAVRVLARRASREDADAYRFWLGAVAARVCQAARTAGPFGPGAAPVAPAEREFLARLDRALGR